VPSLGTFELKNLKLEARCLAWWDIFDSTLDVAFTKEDPPHVSWDIEVALGGAGLPLPDCIEDSFLSWLTRLVMLGWLSDVETTVTGWNKRAVNR